MILLFLPSNALHLFFLSCHFSLIGFWLLYHFSHWFLFLFAEDIWNRFSLFFFLSLSSQSPLTMSSHAAKTKSIIDTLPSEAKTTEKQGQKTIEDNQKNISLLDSDSDSSDGLSDYLYQHWDMICAGVNLNFRPKRSTAGVPSQKLTYDEHNKQYSESVGGPPYKVNRNWWNS